MRPAVPLIPPTKRMTLGNAAHQAPGGYGRRPKDAVAKNYVTPEYAGVCAPPWFPHGCGADTFVGERSNCPNITQVATVMDQGAKTELENPVTAAEIFISYSLATSICAMSSPSTSSFSSASG